MTNNIVIETFDLSKKFKYKGNKKKINALNKLNISVKEKEIFGLIGPNGAGKTTLIRILATIIQPTSGDVFIDGFNISKNSAQIKSKISLMLDKSMLYNRITGYSNLKFFCKIYNISNYKEKIYNIAKEFGLNKWLNQYVENFSSGMKMKLALCRTLLLDRKILILDEPAMGLDVETTDFIVNKLKDLNRTILLTSHNMSVVEKLCDRIALINKGNLLKIGTQQDFKKLIQTKIKIEITIIKNKNQLKSELNQQEFINEIIVTNESFVVSLKNRDYYKDLLLILGKYNILKIREIELSLEELFLKLFKNKNNLLNTFQKT